MISSHRLTNVKIIFSLNCFLIVVGYTPLIQSELDKMCVRAIAF